MNIIGIIPARMGSSRFPGKPLAPIAGYPMIEHVYYRSILSKSLSDVYIATCDNDIAEVVKEFGGKVVLTKTSHDRASDRVSEAMLKIEQSSNKKVDIVVMIQGDEPLVFPEMINAAIDALKQNPEIQVANLLAPLKTQQEQEDFNEIKVVIDKNFDALYFSRAPIPAKVKPPQTSPMYKQVCIIPFRRDYLIKFNSLEQTPLEISESIDMLRVLENGQKVKMVLTPFETYSVDTPADLKRVEAIIVKDPLFTAYIAKRKTCTLSSNQAQDSDL